MKPLFMTMCGWGPYKEETKIDFTKLDQNGLFLVTGATGSGKTTIFDGIMYALYGKVTTQVRERESVRSDFCTPEDLTYVNLLFCHKGKVYEIIRSPKYYRPKKRGGKEGELVEEKEKAYFCEKGEVEINYSPSEALALYRQREAESVVEGITDVTRRVEELLRMDEKQFKQTTMIAQGEFTKLLFAAPKEKTQIFRNLFGTGIYEKFVQRLKQKVKELSEEIRLQRGKMEEAVSGIDVETPEWSTFFEGEVPPYRQMLGYLEQEITETKKKEKDISKQLQMAEEKCTLLTKKRTKAEEIMKRFEELRQIKEALEGLKQQEEDKEKAKKELEAAKAVAVLLPFKLSVDESEANRKRLVEKDAELAKKHAELEKTRDNLAFYRENEFELQEIFQKLTDYSKMLQEEEQAKKAILNAEKELKEGQQTFLEKENQKQQAKEKYEHLLTVRQRAAVGIVLKDLKEGCPCPVCGSLEHPKIAVWEDKIPEEKEIANAKKVFEKAEKEYNQCFAETSALKERIRILKAENEQMIASLGEKKTGLCKLISQHVVTSQWGAFAKETEEEKFLSEVLKINEEWLGQYENTSNSVTDIMTGQKNTPKCLNDIAKKWEQMLGQYLKAGLENERLLHGNEEMQKASKEQIASEEKRYDDAKKRFLVQCENQLCELCKSEDENAKEEHQGEDEKETQYLNYISKWQKDEKWMKETQKSVDVFYENYRLTEENLKRCEEYCATLEVVDINLISEEQNQAKQEKDDLAGKLRTIGISLTGYQKAVKSLKEKLSRVETLEERFGIYQNLLQAADGKNKKRLVFEQYVLAYFFEDILKAANLRFAKISGGRYRMDRSKEVSDGRVKDNLEIEVHDYYTGKKRSVKTLSGGESFKASLSLALGMSDVIQKFSGGISVETLFIDEGFGSLDTESLNQACETLFSLAGNNTFIGIISHVEELKERVPAKIIVDKTSNGSFVTVQNY